MYPRPISYPQWPLDGPNSVQPTAELSMTGWGPGVAPDAQNFNWLLGDVNAWIQYLDTLTSTGLPLSVIRLINGGTWSFDATSGELAWSSAFNLAIPPLSDSSNQVPAGDVTMADGQVAYVVSNTPSFSQGDTSTTVNPNQITNMNFTANISVGDSVTGPGIPNGTTVLGVGTNFVTLSQNVTSNNSGATYSFASVGGLTVIVVNETDFFPEFNTILIARRAGNVIYLGVNAPQMVLRDGEFKTLIGSGYFSLYQAPAGQNLTTGTLCYISPGSSDGGRTAGALYPLDVSVTNQAIRGTYAGVIITDVNTEQMASIMYSGFFTESGLMSGAEYYADPSTPGGITVNQPSGAGQKIEPIGFAVTSSILLFTGVAAGVTSLQFPIFAEDDFSGNASTATFTLTQPALSENSVFPFVDGLLIPNSKWTFAANAVTLNFTPQLGQSIEIKYILASQTYLAGAQALAANPSGDLVTFILPFVPTNQASTFVYVDGIIVPSAVWSLLVGGGTAEIIFNAALGAGQQVYVTTFTTTASGGGGGGGGGTITGASNIGGGIGIFSGVSGSVLQFFSILAGANTTVAYDGHGNIVISSTGGGGGSISANGDFAAPVQISPSGGLTPQNVNDQVWWLAPLSGGATPITANPQILAGGAVGQRLTLKGTSATNYYIFSDGNGLSLNGPINLTNNNSIELMWDGSQWSENSRRG